MWSKVQASMELELHFGMASYFFNALAVFCNSMKLRKYYR